MTNTIPTTAIILAAGKGTRMKSTLPKVMHAIANLPMVGHVMNLALSLDAAPIAVVTAQGMDSVADIARELGGDVDIAIQKEQHGTAHAVLAAKPALGDIEGNLLILYGDTPLLTKATIEELLETLESDPRCAVAVLGFEPEDPGSYGRLIENEDGTLDRIVEAKDATDDELMVPLCNSGVMAIKGPLAWKLLAKVDNKNAKGEYYLTDVVAIARSMGHIARAVACEEEEVLGVNSRNELAVAEAIFQFRTRKMHMDAGVTLVDPDSTFFSADTVIGPDTLIEPNVFFGPEVLVGTGVHIKAFSHIEGSVIGTGTTVGPFARLRPGTTLGENVRIGNFVELKKSQIADGAKISHLSYVGDATVGTDANLGAGTITCNYDGYNKHKTIIGAEVFIGSNSALVAPITIGDGAMVAAGSVITENIDADALGLARSRQQAKPGWSKDFRAKQDKK